MLAKYDYDVLVDLHQTEFEGSKYNAKVVLPFMQKDLPEPVREFNQRSGDFIVKAWREMGATPMPRAASLDYGEDQLRYFRACWTEIYKTVPALMIEVQNNNRRTPPREQLRITETAIQASIDFVLNRRPAP